MKKKTIFLIERVILEIKAFNILSILSQVKKGTQREKNIELSNLLHHGQHIFPKLQNI